MRFLTVPGFLPTVPRTRPTGAPSPSIPALPPTAILPGGRTLAPTLTTAGLSGGTPPPGTDIPSLQRSSLDGLRLSRRPPLQHRSLWPTLRPPPPPWGVRFPVVSQLRPGLSRLPLPLHHLLGPDPNPPSTSWGVGSPTALRSLPSSPRTRLPRHVAGRSSSCGPSLANCARSLKGSRSPSRQEVQRPRPALTRCRTQDPLL